MWPARDRRPRGRYAGLPMAQARPSKTPNSDRDAGVQPVGPTFHTMAHRTYPTTAAGIALTLALFIAWPMVAAPPPTTLMHTVALTAWLDAGDGHAQDIIVEVEVDGNKDWGRANENGRVDLMLPADVVAVIHFRKPGHLTKSLAVDTHNMNDGTFKGKQRSFSFAVALEPNKELDGMAYAGPVGSIAFDKGGGCLVVEHDQHLVPMNRQQKVVF